MSPMTQEIIKGMFAFFGVAFVILSPLIIYKIFFKKQVEHTAAGFRSFILNDKHIELFTTTLQSYGFTLCTEDDPLLKLHKEHQPSEIETVRALWLKSNP